MAGGSDEGTVDHFYFFYTGPGRVGSPGARPSFAPSLKDLHRPTPRQRKHRAVVRFISTTLLSLTTGE
jgi:hypothetical protein